MIGKAYFYKGEFDEAIKTFNFISEEYKKTNISYESLLWLARCYIEKNDYSSAESILIDLDNNRKFPQEYRRDYEIINADLYLRQKNYPLAKEAILNSLNKYKHRKDKGRLNFIVAQIYQIEEQYTRATKHYNEVLKSNADYSMVFNTKMNLALCSDKSSKDSEKMRKQLVKMTKDDKNKEYLDQIYYTIAEMEINNGDTASAMENYRLSAASSIENESQKSLSFLALGKIYFEKGLYKSANTYYDSTIFYMEEEFRLYNQAKEKHETLSSLIRQLDIIYMQDSLQRLAKLPRGELNKAISQIIQNEIENVDDLKHFNIDSYRFDDNLSSKTEWVFIR